jgi:hypothetical protein
MTSTREMSTDSGSRALGSPDTEKNDVARALVHLNEANQIVTLIKVTDDFLWNLLI